MGKETPLYHRRLWAAPIFSATPSKGLKAASGKDKRFAMEGLRGVDRVREGALGASDAELIG